MGAGAPAFGLLRIIPRVQPVRAWLIVGPAVLAGVLAGHELAYRITGTSEGPAHDYLDHAPQIVLFLLVLGLTTARLGARMRVPAAWQLPVAAVATFVVQEHVERLVHTGGVPWILTSPVFLVGLALQLPIALVAWLVTRGVLEALAQPARARAHRVSRPLVSVPIPAGSVVPAVVGPSLPGRGPPPLCRS